MNRMTSAFCEWPVTAAYLQHGCHNLILIIYYVCDAVLYGIHQFY